MPCGAQWPTESCAESAKPRNATRGCLTSSLTLRMPPPCAPALRRPPRRPPHRRPSSCAIEAEHGKNCRQGPCGNDVSRPLRPQSHEGDGVAPKTGQIGDCCGRCCQSRAGTRLASGAPPIHADAAPVQKRLGAAICMLAGSARLRRLRSGSCGGDPGSLRRVAGHGRWLAPCRPGAWQQRWLGLLECVHRVGMRSGRGEGRRTGGQPARVAQACVAHALDHLPSPP